MYIRLFKTVLLLSLSSVAVAEIKVSVDRQTIFADESFQMYFEADNSVGEPDFSPLRQDFDILAQGQSSQTTLMNGKFTSTKKWVLDVMALRHGKLIIPPIRFGNQLSNASVIEIKAAGTAKKPSGDDIFLDATVLPQQPYVQQQILFTVRLFHAVNQTNGNLSEPKLNGIDVVIQKMGDDRQYETQRNNRRFSVYERRYAIFPQASGRVEIEPITFHGHIGARSGMFSLLDQSRKRIVRRTDNMVVDIRPVPPIYQGQRWLPAKNISLSETWSEIDHSAAPVFHAGEPITRTITLRASGLTASQLPELQLAADQNFKHYPDQPALKDQVSAQGINGSRVQKIAIIPNSPGQYTLPEIVVPWWNTDTDQQEYARLPQRMIDVLPSILPANSQPVQAGAQTSVHGDQTTELIAAPTSLEDSNTRTDTVWLKVSIFLTTGWLITLFCCAWLYFKWSQSLPRLPSTQRQPKQKPAQINRKLKHACQNNNLSLAKDALLIWHDAHSNNVATSLGEMSRHYQGRLADEIIKINYLLYSGQKQDWHGKTLWVAVAEFQQQKTTTIAEKKSGLKPLHQL